MPPWPAWVLLLLPTVLAGSPCPPRDDIRPCICINRSLGRRKLETILVCCGLADEASIETLRTAFADLEVDSLLLYDSFWGMRQTSVPSNVFTIFRAREIEIVDTGMKHFGCPLKGMCDTTYTERFSSSNSTLSDGLSSCSKEFSIHSWLSCTELVEFLRISNGIGKEFHLKPEFFPQSLLKLKELHLPGNKISKIERRTFTLGRFPALHTLNLSHNALREIKHIFYSSLMEIKHLDLSRNSIRSIFNLTNLPHLKTLRLVDNRILVLLENEWMGIPNSLRHLDLSGNSLECNCVAFKWVNSTFPIHTNLLGKCQFPMEVSGMKLRKASRTLIERCDHHNRIVSRSKVRRGRRTPMEDVSNSVF